MSTPVTLASLLPPVTADQAKALLLETLQGIGPVEQIGNGTGTVVVSGAPVASYDIVIQVTTGGAPGSAAFKYSLDGGTTFSGPFAVPGSGTYSAAGTGLVFQFAGTFNISDDYLLQTVWPPFPVTNWESGGAARTLVEADATTLADLAGNAVPGIAAGGLTQYATGAWLTLLSDQFYENDRFSPAATVGLVLVANSTSSPIAVNAGDLVGSNSQGTGQGAYTFSNSGSASIPGNGSLAIPFQATQPGAAYNIANSTLLFLQKGKPGLSISNPAPGTSAVNHVGAGAGVVAVTATPTANWSVVLKVLTTGALGAATAQISLDGGSNYASPFTLPGSGTYAVPQLDGITPTGIVLTLSGASFTATDTYSFTSYSSWVTTPGQNTESDPALQARDDAQWTGLGYGGGTSATYVYLARQTPNAGSEVTKWLSGPDTTTAGQVDVVLAGYNGPISTGALATITTYLKQRTGLCIAVAVSNAGTYTLSVTAQVFCPAQSQPAVSAAIALAFANLAAVTPISGKVFWSDIELALDQKQAGATEVFLTVPSPNTDTQLPPNDTVAFNLAGVTYVLS